MTCFERATSLVEIIVCRIHWLAQEKDKNWPSDVEKATTNLFQTTLSSLYESLLWKLSTRSIDDAVTNMQGLQLVISSIVTNKRDDADSSGTNETRPSYMLKPYLLKLFYKFEGRFREAVGIQTKVRAIKCIQLVIRLSSKELRPFISRCVIFLTLATANEKLLVSYI